MAVLYVTRPGAEVRKRKARLAVEWQGGTLAALPLRDVERVVLLGPAQVGAAATRSLLQAGIPVAFCSTQGRYYGALAAGQEHTELLLAQVERYRDEVYRLGVAKAIVSAKIRHSRSLLRRQVRNHPQAGVAAAAEQLTLALARVEDATSVPEAMGCEGRAAAVYFPAYGACFADEGVRFTQRSRRPPRDPANAVLSLGYMLVLAEVAGALAGEGLHLGLGFLHEVSPRRPALPLDVLELFRQPVVDRLALSLFNRRVFTAESFQWWPDGKVLFKEEALKRYLTFYERAMTTPFRQPGGGDAATFRTLIREQARALRLAVQGAGRWAPLTLDL